MKFEIIWSKKSVKQLKKLDKTLQDRIYKKVGKLKNNPFIYVERVSGAKLYKLRVGKYRVIMAIERGKLVILVLDVDHRDRIYRKTGTLSEKQLKFIDMMNKVKNEAKKKGFTDKEIEELIEKTRRKKRK